MQPSLYRHQPHTHSKRQEAEEAAQAAASAAAAAAKKKLADDLGAQKQEKERARILAQQQQAEERRRVQQTIEVGGVYRGYVHNSHSVFIPLYKHNPHPTSHISLSVPQSSESVHSVKRPSTPCAAPCRSKCVREKDGESKECLKQSVA